MPEMLLDRRCLIQQDLEKAIAGYPELWRSVTVEWRDFNTGNQAWLTYSANYLYSCNGFRWALDPFSMTSRVANLEAPDYRADLAPLALVVLTHAHNDHLDLALIQALSGLSIKWVIPAFLMERISQELTLPEDQVITPVPGEWINVGPLRLLPFESLHIRDRHGVQEMGYLAQMDNQRWLFPGDIRSFDFYRLPSFGRLDVVVAHLWLGKARAMDESPPLLSEFCDFYTSFETERLIITHLNEFGRDETELWREEHFELVKLEILRRCPGMRVEKAFTGDQIDLG